MWGGPRNPFILGGAALSLSAVITPILGGGALAQQNAGPGPPPPVGHVTRMGHQGAAMGAGALMGSNGGTGRRWGFVGRPPAAPSGTAG